VCQKTSAASVGGWTVTFTYLKLSPSGFGWSDCYGRLGDGLGDFAAERLTPNAGSSVGLNVGSFWRSVLIELRAGFVFEAVLALGEDWVGEGSSCPNCRN